jgi:CheY-like chemotaxis protein
MAPSSEAALAMLAVIAPAVIVSDIMMAGRMSGYEFGQCLQRDKNLRGIPVILLTGENEPNGFKAGNDARAVMYATKPFKPESLLNAVRMPCPAQRVRGD